MPQFIRVLNFEKFQHYRDRKPPWIKLYRDILDDERFFDLTDGERYQLFGLFILASQHDNLIPNKPEWLKHQLRCQKVIPLQRLIDTCWVELMEQNASGLLAPCNTTGLASGGQRERQNIRQDTEGETEAPGAERAPAARDVAFDIFAEAYRRALGTAYMSKKGDFVQLAEFRKANSIQARAAPPDWQAALGNYFARPKGPYTLAELVTRYGEYRNSTTDKYGTMTAHKGAHNESPAAARERRNDEAIRTAMDILEAQQAGESSGNRNDADIDPYLRRGPERSGPERR